MITCVREYVVGLGATNGAVGVTGGQFRFEHTIDRDIMLQMQASASQRVARFTIPTDLLDMIQDRRVIPFVGAGFSAALNLPGWDELLAKISTEIEDTLPYEQVKNCCGSDPLQIAEYFFLKSDRSIGPLRHHISREMQVAGDPVMSGAHVELVNLGAPQIYTTNYDDLIELTFKRLSVPVNVVALPKHVAAADKGKAQVVKYHGDLRHESTLVLTESSYYARLDFESPMDLKFRSDLLGRSVLFMGYSFRDINIRIIWFKLMRMMKDIPEGDRPRSYIVRFERNPVLETLYDAVGLKTIVLDPEGTAQTPQERNELFARFMLELTMRASSRGTIPGLSKPMFMSVSLLESIAAEFADRVKTRIRQALTSPRLQVLLEQFAVRQVPEELAPRVADLLLKIGRNRHHPAIVRAALNYAKQFKAAPGVTLVLAYALTSSDGRDVIGQHSNVPWGDIWASRLSPDDAAALVTVLREEVQNHRHGNHDFDLAYAVDVVARIVSGELLSLDSTEVNGAAKAAIKQAGDLYTSVQGHRPKKGEAPQVDAIIAQIQQSIDETASTTDDVPF